jgi:hypothetical protein
VVRDIQYAITAIQLDGLKFISGLKYERCEFVDKCNGREVFKYRDRKGKAWLKHGRFELFKVESTN